MKIILLAMLLTFGVLAADVAKPGAGDVKDAITKAVGRDIVVDGECREVSPGVVEVQYKPEATAQEKATAATVIANFDWNTKPVSQNDTDKATLKILSVKDPKTWTADEIAAFRAAVCRLLSQ